MYGMFRGKPIFGPAGPDGNPIGTVISYMGTKAPTDYLICDGSIYNISAYSKLAEFFSAQFGSKNYFGGNGTTTFAVPDMRNLFLRGFHGTSEQLSGDVGVKQEGTVHENITTNCLSSLNGASLAGRYYYGTMEQNDKHLKNPDSVVMRAPDVANYSSTDRGHPDQSSDFSIKLFTSRPINMAVLYCIKATESISADSVNDTIEEYDANDGWHVRKWNSGYVEFAYSKIWNFEEYGTTFAKTGYGAWITQTAFMEFPRYPFPLLQVYSITKTANGGGQGWAICDYDSLSYGPSSESSRIAPSRIALTSVNTVQPSTSNTSVYPLISVYVTGRWK